MCSDAVIGYVPDTFSYAQTHLTWDFDVLQWFSL
jgi:hypothetical protein